MSTIQRHLRFSADLDQELQAYAHANELSITSAIRLLLRQALAAGSPTATIQRGGGGWISGPSTTTRKET